MAADFRTRDPQRDRETDLNRLDRLIGLLQQLQAEVDAERSGLESRYSDAQSAAAYALDAFENGDGDDLAARADELSGHMRRYRERIEILGEQEGFLRDVEARILDFRGDPG